MPNFIQHSFSATENSPVLQFALDNLAGGKSLLIGLKSSNFQDLFCSLGFGIAANVLSNGANLGILSDDESLKKAFEGLISQQNWAELFINFQPEKIAEYLNQISQRKRSHSLKFPLPSRSVRVLQLCAAQIQAHRQTLQKWAEFRHNGLSYSELVVKNLQKKEWNILKKEY